MGKIVTISKHDVIFKKNCRLMKCPKCGKWNRVEHQQLIDKIFYATCEGCGTKYRPE
ncbi:MAG: hypothetical protein U9O89_07660 [Thermoproteota archaeon]|nr:hypothetical protein [Thermoproteota archaeon]